MEDCIWDSASNMELQKKRETNLRLKTNKPYGLTNTCGIHQSKSYFCLVRSLNPIVPTAAPLLDLEDTRSATAGPSRLPASKNAEKNHQRC